MGPNQGLYSLSGNTSYRQFSWSFEAARLYVIMIASIWNLTDTHPTPPHPYPQCCSHCCSYTARVKYRIPIHGLRFWLIPSIVTTETKAPSGTSPVSIFRDSLTLLASISEVEIGLGTFSPLSVAILTDYKSYEIPDYLDLSSKIKRFISNGLLTVWGFAYGTHVTANPSIAYWDKTENVDEVLIKQHGD